MPGPIWKMSCNNLLVLHMQNQTYLMQVYDNDHYQSWLVDIDNIARMDHKER
jgi:hypothetical protein